MPLDSTSLEASEWKIEEIEGRELDEPSILFITPENFTFTLRSKRECLELLSMLSLRGGHFSLQDSRIQITPDGDLLCIDTDPWVNSGIAFGQRVTSAPVLAYAIKKYLIGKL